jgi:hypothetical protein
MVSHIERPKYIQAYSPPITNIEQTKISFIAFTGVFYSLMSIVLKWNLLGALLATFMFMTAWVFEARHCPTLLNEIKKTKLDGNTEPQAGINILLAAVPFIPNLYSPKRQQ